MKHEVLNAEAWNGAAGNAWVATEALLDRLFAPIDAVLVDGSLHGSVLDVGCGTGATALAIAKQARCVGIDVSAPMIEAARARAEREQSTATFVQADAQTHAFESRFDAIASRFGVMFFAEPVAAFANLHGATKPGGTLRLVVWRSADDNAFMTVAERAAAPLVRMPARSADGPGQFAFADAERVSALLQAAGWGQVNVQALDVECGMHASELELYFTRLGPLGRALPALDTATRARVLTAVRAAFEPYVHGPEVRFTAACWLVTATASRS